MKNAYLIHGTSTRDDDWFPWLEEEAKPTIALDRIWLPNPFNPQQAEWDQAVDDQIHTQDNLILGFYWWEHLIRDYQLIPN